MDSKKKKTESAELNEKEVANVTGGGIFSEIGGIFKRGLRRATNVVDSVVDAGTGTLDDVTETAAHGLAKGIKDSARKVRKRL